MWAWICKDLQPKLPTPFMPKSPSKPPTDQIPIQIIKPLQTLKRSLSEETPVYIPKSRIPHKWRFMTHKIRKHLSDNKCIMKPADKGACLVILSEESYLKEGYSQLANQKFYKALDPEADFSTLSCPQSLTDQTLQCLKWFQSKGYLSEKQVEFLTPDPNGRPRRFYLLPKIHKPMQSWPDPGKTPPGRPICSNTNSPTYELCKYVDHLLTPISTIHPSYIRDSEHFLSELSRSRFPPQCTLATMDISSLYTCINNQDGIAAVTETMSEFYSLDPNDPYITNTCKLLELCLTNNTFKFNDSPYIQVSGCAMGHHYAPRLANVFTAKLEQRALPLITVPILHYARFLDDIFIVFDGPPAAAHHIQEVFNSINPHIKFTIETDRSSVSFLDVLIFKDSDFSVNGKLSHRVYTKPTDTKQLLHFDSFHPRHVHRSIIRSQIIRYHRLSSSHTTFMQEVKALFATLKNRGYPHRILQTEFKSWERDYIQTPRGSHPCAKPHCICCATGNVIQTTQVEAINDLETDTPPQPPKQSFKIKNHINCSTPGVVYLIQCDQCTAAYVGHTIKDLRTRYQQHLQRFQQVSTRPPSSPHVRSTELYEHFLSCGSMEKARLTLLERVAPSKEQTTSPTNPYPPTKQPLLALEALWIHRLGTSLERGGLNTVVPPVPPLLPFITKFSSNSQFYTRQIREACSELAQHYPTFFALGPIMAHTIHHNTRSLFCKAADPKKSPSPKKAT
jgi:hypothetical protein